jgi:hypothetical protein
MPSAATNARSAAVPRALVADGKGKRSRVCFRQALASSLRRDRFTQNRSALRLRFPTPTPDRSILRNSRMSLRTLFDGKFASPRNDRA